MAAEAAATRAAAAAEAKKAAAEEKSRKLAAELKEATEENARLVAVCEGAMASAAAAAAGAAAAPPVAATPPAPPRAASLPTEEVAAAAASAAFDSGYDYAARSLPSTSTLVGGILPSRTPRYRGHMSRLDEGRSAVGPAVAAATVAAALRESGAALRERGLSLSTVESGGSGEGADGGSSEGDGAAAPPAATGTAATPEAAASSEVGKAVAAMEDAASLLDDLRGPSLQLHSRLPRTNVAEHAALSAPAPSAHAAALAAVGAAVGPVRLKGSPLAGAVGGSLLGGIDRLVEERASLEVAWTEGKRRELAAAAASREQNTSPQRPSPLQKAASGLEAAHARLALFEGRFGKADAC